MVDSSLAVIACHDPVNRLKRVDLPALVGPIRATSGSDDSVVVEFFSITIKTMFYAQVIVAERTHAEELTYAVPAGIVPYIRLGSLVTAPLKKRIVTGVVVGLVKNVSKDLQAKLRPLNSINKTRTISAETIKLIHSLSNHYGASIAEVAFHVLSNQGKYSNIPKKLSELVVKTNKPTLLIAPLMVRLSYYLENYFRDNSPVLLLFAQTKDANAFRQLVKERGIDLSVKVIGTLSQAFYPLPAGSTIVVDRPFHPGAKSRQRPLMSLRTICLHRSKIEGLRLLLGSELVAPNYLNMVQKKELRLITQLPIVAKVTVTQQQGNSLKPSTRKVIETSLQNKKKVLILTASNSWATSLFCQSCNQVVTCTNCQRTITLSDENTLQCYYCGFRASVPEICQNCDKPAFKPLGVGASKVISDLTEYSFKKSSPNDPAVAAKGKLVVSNEQQISLDDSNFDVIILIGFDRLRVNALPNGSWRLLGLLIELQAKPVQLIIETNSIEDKIWGTVNSQKLKELLSADLLERKKYNLPPFGRELVLRGKGSDKTVNKEIEKVEQIIDLQNKLVISEINSHPLNKEVQVKINLYSSFQLSPTELKSFRQGLSGFWQVDIEP